MFAVYGLRGEAFSGAMEELIQYRKVNRRLGVPPVVPTGEQIQTEVLTDAVNAPFDPLARAASYYQSMARAETNRGPLYTARQIMQTSLLSVHTNNSVTDAWQKLRNENKQEAPVLDDAQQIVGVVSERDLLTSINVQDERVTQSLNRTVGEVMTSPVVVAQAETDIRRIAHIMVEFNIDGVPIINRQNELIGFVSRRDMLRCINNEPPLSLWC